MLISALWFLFLYFTTVFSDCDCAARWTFHKDNAVVGGFSDSVSPLFSESTFMRHPLHNIYVTADDRIPAAQTQCHRDKDCDGFFVSNIVSVSEVVYFRLDPESSSPEDQPELLSRLNGDGENYYTYVIDRMSAYKGCGSSVARELSEFFYYFQSGARTSIEQHFCVRRQQNGETCCWYDNGGSGICQEPSSSSNAISIGGTTWITVAQQYYNTYGHVNRDQPNDQCFPSPSIYSESSNCSLPQTGCYIKGPTQCSDNIDSRPPCGGGGIGYCAVTEGDISETVWRTPFHCECQNRTLIPGVPLYIGMACEYNVDEEEGACLHGLFVCGGADRESHCVPTIVDDPILTHQCVQIEGQFGKNLAPRCDCDRPTHLTEGGEFCEDHHCGTLLCNNVDTINQCGYFGTNSTCNGTEIARRCDPITGLCDDLTICDGTNYHCVCDPDNWLGTNCTTSMATCKESPADDPCSDSGNCLEPANSCPNGNENCDDDDAWCQCTASRRYGQFCQNIGCDPDTTIVNHTICNPTTGAPTGCYNPYTTFAGALECATDLCVLTNGTAVDFRTCQCNPKVQQELSDNPYVIEEGLDVTCYPVCPSQNNVTCGVGIGSNLAVCSTDAPPLGDKSDITDVLPRTADCTCAETDTGACYSLPGIIYTTATNQTQPGIATSTSTVYVCETLCKNSGTLRRNDAQGGGCQSFVNDRDDPTSCSYSANWGKFNTSTDVDCRCNCSSTAGFTGDRCETFRCQNGGTWNTSTHTCNCPGPHTDTSDCVDHTCNHPTTTYIEGQVHDTLTTTCDCFLPFTWSDGTHQDCDVHRCDEAEHGDLNTSVITNGTHKSTVQQMCICSGVYTTTCNLTTINTGCEFCSGHICQHTGTPDPLDEEQCECPFPFQGDVICSTDICDHGEPNGVGNNCTCFFNFTGAACDIHPCESYQFFNDTSEQCENITISSSSSSTGISSSSTADNVSSSSTAVAAAVVAVASVGFWTPTVIGLVSAGGAVAAALLAYMIYALVPKAAVVTTAAGSTAVTSMAGGGYGPADSTYPETATSGDIEMASTGRNGEIYMGDY